MFFNSLAFCIFLPLVFCLYWFVFGRNLKLQNLFVVAASYVFYGWWDWRFLILIAITSFFSWGSGLLIYKYRSDGRKSYWISALNIIINLAILAMFKYYDFFAQSFADLFLNGESDGILLHLILPVGISFYTFQALSYSIDVYKGKTEPTRDIVQFFAYVSFFPQLVAGPIERATNLLPQFGRRREFDYGQAVDGLKQMLWGFFKKIVIADECGRYVDYVYGSYQGQPGCVLLLCAVFFTFQIYGDFSGYSDIAIGTAKLFGIKLMSNFKTPFFSRNIAYLPHLLVQGLCLHPARRQQMLDCQDNPQYAHHFPVVRPLARCQLDVRIVGCIQRHPVRTHIAERKERQVSRFNRFGPFPASL